MMTFRKEELMGGWVAALATCLLLLGVVLAGCGGGGDEGTTAANGGGATTEAGGGKSESQNGGEASGDSQEATEEPMSEAKADFVAKANAFCQEQLQQLQAKLQQTFKTGQGFKTPAAERAALSRLAKEAIGPAMQAEAEELRALGAPEGEGKQVEAIAASLEAIAAKADKDPAGLVANINAFEQAKKLAGEYGLTACGRAA